MEKYKYSHFDYEACYDLVATLVSGYFIDEFVEGELQERINSSKDYHITFAYTNFTHKMDQKDIDTINEMPELKFHSAELDVFRGNLLVIRFKHDYPILNEIVTKIRKDTGINLDLGNEYTPHITLGKLRHGKDEIDPDLWNLMNNVLSILGEVHCGELLFKC